MEKILGILLILIIVYLFLEKNMPFLFWKKIDLEENNLAKWDKVYAAKIISRKNLQRASFQTPQCESCFMFALKRPDFPRGTIVDPIFAGYNVVAIRINNDIIYFCKKHKIQIIKSEIFDIYKLETITFSLSPPLLSSHSSRHVGN